jgi:hypothetical protein
MLGEVAGPLGAARQTFSCGPSLLVEAAATAPVQLGTTPQPDLHRALIPGTMAPG